MTQLAMPELRRSLVEAARIQQVSASASQSDRAAVNPGARWSPQGMRRSRVRAAVVVALLVLGGTAGAFASGLISFGSPAASVPVFADPGVGLGRIAQGSVQLLPISVADPRGGPPWGMRVLRTTRGAGCLQVGRLVDGRLAALGQDGAFSNDGLAHELPLSTNIDRLNCSLVDRRGRLFENVTIKSQAASAAPGEHCRPPGTYPPSHAPAPSPCPLTDERNLYYGMLGPDATSLTYTAGGQSRTLATVGSDGAYLIVTTGTAHRYTGAAGASERRGLYASDEVPVYGPITAIHYRGGATCNLVTAERYVSGARACSPALPQPYGYIQPMSFTATMVATPVHASVYRGPGGGWAIRIRFRSKVAILSLRGHYLLRWHYAGEAHGGEALQEIAEGGLYAGIAGGISQSRDIKAGQTLITTINEWATPRRGTIDSSLPPGVITGRVTLDYSNGASIEGEEDTVRLPVGAFKITVP